MKIKSKLGVAIVAGVLLFFAVIFSRIGQPNQFIENSAQAGHAVLTNKSNFGLPINLKIPKINVNARVESVGLTALGAMDVPTGPSTVAWYDLGPRPGDFGSSVIDGHSGYKNNKPAVFDSLYKLKVGDKIYAQDEKGSTITFVVRELRSYGRNQNASDVFASNDGGSHLNLITCTGDWDTIGRTHSNRLVVFTDRI